jgi:D-alanyl-D-alanine carboxypeptidase
MTTMTNRSITLPLLLLLQVSLLVSTRAIAQGSKPSLAAKIDAIAAAELSKPGGAGLSIAVAQRGRILHSKGYGKADLEFDVPANEETMFRIGSVTKQFTAALLMRLIEQGKLTLDDELSKYVPDFPLQGRKVTIRQLLQHTSGIKSYTELGESWRKLWPLELTHAELLALVKDAPFDFEPGSSHHYSNTGYYLLGMVIEKVTGKSYAEHLLAEICGPLELTRTRYDSHRDLIRNRAQGYGLERGAIVNDHALGMAQPGAAGGILSTAKDLVHWQMVLTSGKFVASDSFARMRTPTVLPNGRNTFYGFGLKVVEWEGKPRVEHGGGIFGFNSMLFWLPDEDLHVAVISNGEPISSDKIADAVGRAALGIEPPKVKDEPIKPDLITRLSGDFVLEKIGLEFKVFEREGKLMVQATGQDAFRILWQGGDAFRADFDPEVRLDFAPDGKSLVLFQKGRKAEGVRK